MRLVRDCKCGHASHRGEKCKDCDCTEFSEILSDMCDQCGSEKKAEGAHGLCMRCYVESKF